MSPHTTSPGLGSNLARFIASLMGAEASCKYTLLRSVSVHANYSLRCFDLGNCCTVKDYGQRIVDLDGLLAAEEVGW